MTDLDQTRALLAQIPALAAKLPQLATAIGSSQTNADSNVRTGVPGSRPPMSVALLDLIEGRDIEWWTMLAIDEMVEADLEPKAAPTSRTPNIGENCQWLSRNAEWISENNPDFTAEIKAIHWTYRRASGDLPGRRVSCFQCGNPAFIDGLWLICREVEEHARTVKSIENEWRFAAKQTTAQICQRFPVTEDQLYQWRRRNKIHPIKEDGRLWWWPWDVLLALNPVLAEEIEKRDSLRVG